MILAASRETVAAAVSPLGVPVHPYPPESLVPPFAVVLPSPTAYISGGTMDGRAVIGFVVQITTLAKHAARLDEMLEAALRNIRASNFRLNEAIPGPTVDVETGFLSARLPIFMQATITG